MIKRRKKHNNNYARMVDEIIGKKFGSWTVLRKTDSDKAGHVRALCECSCGRRSPVRVRALFVGKSSRCLECGMRRRLKYNMNDYIGKTFGQLTVIEEVSHVKWHDRAMKCKCSCGETFITSLHAVVQGKKQCNKCGWSNGAKKGAAIMSKIMKEKWRIRKLKHKDKI